MERNPDKLQPAQFASHLNSLSATNCNYNSIFKHNQSTQLHNQSTQLLGGGNLTTKYNSTSCGNAFQFQSSSETNNNNNNNNDTAVAKGGQ